MKKIYYFIAGLHRSGSTVLSSILNQNPRFYSGPLSPVLQLMKNLEFNIGDSEFYQAYPKPAQAHEIISSLIDHYYSDIQNPVIFDKSRIWPRHINYIESYIKTNAKIICMVRSIDEILISFLNIIHKNTNHITFNLIDRSIISSNADLTDYNRCDFLLNGIINDTLSSLKFAFDHNLQDRLLLVEYNDLVLNPQLTFKTIYNFLGEEYYSHNFDWIQNNNLVNDNTYYGLSGLHDVREKLQISPKNPKIILSDDILQRCEEMKFWSK
jgi:sulfotransferase